MATAATTSKDAGQGVQDLLEGLQQNEKSALDAMKRFVDTVNDAFPDISEGGPRQQIIDAAFKMTEQVVDASNRLATNLVDVAQNAIEGITKSES
ncbi:MAG: hypothetical protein KDA95_00880 [Acidimicrobiales bacterium]|nr:hypothetical protein [Acidimicrobiales bacterium]